MPIDQGLFELALAEGFEVCTSEKHLCTAAPNVLLLREAPA